MNTVAGPILIAAWVAWWLPAIVLRLAQLEADRARFALVMAIGDALNPFDWRQLSASVRFRRASGRCERCGRPHGREVVVMHDSRWWDEDAQR